MRTTLTLEDNLLQTLKKKAAERHVPFKTIVNQVLQQGLEAMEAPPSASQRFHTKGKSMKQKQGFDLDKLGQIADEMEDDEKLRIT